MRAGLTIAGIEIELTVEAGPLETMVAGRYAPFLGASSNPVCSVRIDPWEGTKDLAHPALALVARQASASFRISHPAFFGLLDLEGKSTLHCVAFTSNLDHALRTVFALLGPYHGGLMLRACGVITGGEAHVFVGPAGAGKTTVAASAGHRPLLTDGYVMVRRLAVDHWLAGSTPFWSSYDSPDPPRELRLSRLWSLRSSPVLHSDPSDAGDSNQALLTNILLPASDPNFRKIALDLALELASAVPSSELCIGPTTSLWREIEESVA